MVAPSQIAAARAAPDRWQRVAAMAEIMRDGAAGQGACTMGALRAAGFTEGEIFANADEARAVLSGRPGAGKPQPAPARAEGERLAAEARRIRRRIDKRRAA